MKICLTATLMFLLSSLSARADEHQYVVTALPKSDVQPYQSALIIDEKTGDLWEYTEAPGTSGNQPYKDVFYLGKVRPGEKPLDTVISAIKQHP